LDEQLRAEAREPSDDQLVDDVPELVVHRVGDGVDRHRVREAAVVVVVHLDVRPCQHHVFDQIEEAVDVGIEVRRFDSLAVLGQAHRLPCVGHADDHRESRRGETLAAGPAHRELVFADPAGFPSLPGFRQAGERIPVLVGSGDRAGERSGQER
jgi:hypothetical protein